MRKIDTILDNLRTLTNAVTDREMCILLGLNYNTLDNWKKKDSIPMKRLDEFSKRFNISIDDLRSTSENSVSSNTLRTDDTISINYYFNIRVSAGYGATNFDIQPTKLIFDKKYLSDIVGINVFKDLEMVKVLGDSMEPFVNDGDFAIIQRRSEAKNNEVAIVNINGDVYVKRVIKDITNKEVRFVSFNENYPDIVLKNSELDGVAIIGVVIAKFDMNVKIF